MGKHSRDKGANGERECARLLQKVFNLPEAPKRQLSQYQTPGQSDFVFRVDDVTYSVECKRYATITLAMAEQFWRECVSQVNGDEVPLLLYRADRQPWRLRVPLRFLTKAAEPIEYWAELTSEAMRAILGTSTDTGVLD